MKSGIYLGPPRSRVGTWLGAAFLTGLAATLGHIAIDFSQRTELEALRQRVGGYDEEANDPGSWSPSETERLWHLAAVASSGAPFALRPSGILALLAETVPEGVSVLSATLVPSGPEPSLLLEAVAKGADDVSALEQRLAASSGISRTQLLEERRTPEGLVSIRLRAELIAAELP